MREAVCVGVIYAAGQENQGNLILPGISNRIDSVDHTWSDCGH